ASRSEEKKPTVSSTTEPAALETDLPELGRLERSMTVDDLLPRREPAPPSGNHMEGKNNRQSDGRVAEKVMAMEARRTASAAASSAAAAAPAAARKLL
ncbi:unnamed protein product, partial [Ectocarpus sp. 6 AP-2014]